MKAKVRRACPAANRCRWPANLRIVSLSSCIPKRNPTQPNPSAKNGKEVFARLPSDQAQSRRAHDESEDDEVSTGPEKEPRAGGDVGCREGKAGSHESQRDQYEGR